MRILFLTFEGEGILGWVFRGFVSGGGGEMCAKGQVD
jgi:hypothetical protein